MVDVPIYRRLAIDELQARQYPLFADRETRDGPLNVLIIESNVDGIVVLENGQNPLKLGPLSQIHNEATELENLLKSPKCTRKLGKVNRLSRDKIPAGSNFYEYLQSQFAEDPASGVRTPWHIVHYCGHSCYDQKRKRGYLFFPGDPIRAVALEEFGKLLNQTRFVYLSSCESSQAGFVVDLAKRQVPGILGFRWKVSDRAGPIFAHAFYESLFLEKAELEVSFVRARKRVRNECGNDRIWAAPILIMQAASP